LLGSKPLIPTSLLYATQLEKKISIAADINLLGYHTKHHPGPKNLMLLSSAIAADIDIFCLVICLLIDALLWQ